MVLIAISMREDHAEYRSSRRHQHAVAGTSEFGHMRDSVAQIYGFVLV